ncbi:MAG: hypothetical protein DBX55_04060 [Verrucomicrobia bacterium]|nr:MAG: hypothetical protein DBX55_04060 [Verrucomicrobiota bacterium]
MAIFQKPDANLKIFFGRARICFTPPYPMYPMRPMRPIRAMYPNARAKLFTSHCALCTQCAHGAIKD